MMPTYIHYGSNEYNPSMFNPITNRDGLTKPFGGLWASNINAEYGWKDWCKDEDFRLERLDSSFTFKLRENANVLFIDSTEILSRLPINARTPVESWTCLDFDSILKSGIDAIDVNITKCWSLYDALYGWDCDSILILNKDIIVAEK